MNCRPYALLAELTYRCPLHCPYCSNPKYHGNHELTTDEWKGALSQAAELGILQVGFSGGEPLQRRDLANIIRVAAEAGLYTNLITSGVGLDQCRADELKSAGLDSVQISFQASETVLADSIAGVRAHAKKIEAGAQVRL